jgi:superoxide dismutase, Fe-Mn family
LPRAGVPPFSRAWLPFSEPKRVLFGNDLWEHAYYLKHHNRRDDYLIGWWNVVTWDAIDARYQEIKAGDTVI